MARLPEIDFDLKLPKPPFWLIAGFLILVVLTWVPLVLIAKMRVTHSTEPRVHLFLDMDKQPRLNTQTRAEVFRDERSMRQPVEGTVARGDLRAADHLYRGFQGQRPSAGPENEGEQGASGDGQSAEPSYYDDYPEEIELTEDFLKRGQEQFNTYCYPCHGKAGYGDGPVHQRCGPLMQTTETSWTQPTSLHTDAVRDRSEGYIYDVITNGVNNMPPYGAQIEVEDRWAIVAYVRALQLAEQFPADRLPAEQREALEQP